MKNIEHLIGKRVSGMNDKWDKITGKLVVNDGQYQIETTLNYSVQLSNVDKNTINHSFDYDKDYTTSQALELVNRAWCKAANIKFVDLSDADYRMFIETNF